MDLKISKTQVRKVVRHGGSLWSLSLKMAPLVMPPAKKATGPIVNRALSGLSSLRVNKLFGNGIQTDGCLIPHNRLGMMPQSSNGLTKRGQLKIQQTRTQGSFLDTLSASVGYTLLLNAFIGKSYRLILID